MLTGYQVLIKDEASLVTVLVYQIFASVDLVILAKLVVISKLGL